MNVTKEEFYQQIVKRICSALDLKTSLCQSLQYLQHFLPVQWMGVNLYEPDLKRLRNIAAARVGKMRALGAQQLDGFSVPLSLEALQFLESVSLPHARLINHPMSEPIGRFIAEAIGSENFSAMVIYIEVQGKWLGNLGLMVDGQGQYTKEHLRLFSLLKDPFAIALSNALQHQEVLKLQGMLEEENKTLLRELHPPSDKEIVGRHAGLKDVMDMVQEVAFRESPVLLIGETGVGKDMVASTIHYRSPRRDGPFVKVNCGAIPDTLIDSELFGHEKGAFTGATNQRRGRFERAHTGTIFLDEIGELPLSAQVRLLNVLQDREIERIGGSQAIKLDFRIIAATNRDLVKMIEEDRFRLDLWYRLKVFPISIPPLRERREDIVPLVRFFIETKARKMNIYPLPTLATGVEDRLINYSWPGNIRELENWVERSLILSKGGVMTFHQAFGDEEKAASSDSFDASAKPLHLNHVLCAHIKRVLRLSRGRIAGPGGAAEMLGIHPNTLRHKMKMLGIPFKNTLKKRL